MYSLSQNRRSENSDRPVITDADNCVKDQNPKYVNMPCSIVEGFDRYSYTNSGYTTFNKLNSCMDTPSPAKPFYTNAKCGNGV